MIYIIRHGEKPHNGEDEEPDVARRFVYEGVELTGGENEHSLIPRGWQRAGALVRFFYPLPALGMQLIAPNYGGKAPEHRAYQTIQPLAELLGVKPQTKYEVAQAEQLGNEVAKATAGVTLICWEHQAIPSIVKGIAPIINPRQVPPEWGPENRFDVVWCLVRESSGFRFAQLPQLLLAGDKEICFPPPRAAP